jgi:hypothetical protein
MKTKTLYRPVGLREMELISESNYRKFPPRLEWQPIFYPVLNQRYAEQIANEWNTPDEFSGFCGIVTAFEVDEKYLQQFEIQNVGDKSHNELWIPSEELPEFNQNIIGTIEIVNVYFGEGFKLSSDSELNNKIEKFR